MREAGSVCYNQIPTSLQYNTGKSGSWGSWGLHPAQERDLPQQGNENFACESP